MIRSAPRPFGRRRAGGTRRDLSGPRARRDVLRPRSQGTQPVAAEPAQLTLPAAIAMGVLQGPTELLPVSSSGHLVLAPWFARSSYCELDPELRKAFEVTLHAGTAAALLIALRADVATASRELDRRRGALLLLSFAPPAIAALAFERTIERHAGRPEVVARGLIAGSFAMLAAQRRRSWRARAEAGPLDGLLLGLAQATALVPGVSRNGATLVAARMAGFAPADANTLSRHAALPVIGGATVLKAVRLARRGAPPEIRRGLLIGAAAAFVSSLVSVRLISAFEQRRSLTPYALYRIGLGATALAVARRRAKSEDVRPGANFTPE